MRLVPPLLRENLVFRRFWLGQTISLFGDQISMIAVPLTAVLVLDANASQMGYLIAAELVPNLFFALHAGAWVDRRGGQAPDDDRRPIWPAVPCSRRFRSRTRSTRSTIQQLYVVAFLVGTMTVFFHVAYASLFVAIVQRETTSRRTRCSPAAARSRSSPGRASGASSSSC